MNAKMFSSQICASILALSCGYSVSAATVTSGVGKVMIDVPSGEDYTLSASDVAVLGSSLDLCKTGVGRLIISTDLKSAGWDGEIVVQNGYLRTTLNGALGGVAKGTTIVPGATLEIEDNSTSYARIHDSEPFSIGGTGVGGFGAVYATKKGKSISTNMMFGNSTVTLTADTTVGYSGTEGFDGSCGFRGATVDMGGFTLTFVKGSNHRFAGGEIINPGRINVEASRTLTLENEINLGDKPDNTLYLGKGATLALQNIGKSPDNIKRPGWKLETEGDAILKMQGDNDCSWYGPMCLGGTLSVQGRKKEYAFRGAISGSGSIVITSPDENPHPICWFDNRTGTLNSYTGGFTLSKGTVHLTGISSIPSLSQGGFSANPGTSAALSATEDDTITDEMLYGIWQGVTTNAPQPPSVKVSTSFYDQNQGDFAFKLGLGRDYVFSKKIEDAITVYHGGEGETLTINSELTGLPNFINYAGTLRLAGSKVQNASWIDLRGGTVEVASGAELNLASNAYVCAPFPGVARLKIGGTYTHASQVGGTRLARNLAIGALCGRGIMEILDGAVVEERFPSSGNVTYTSVPNGWGDDEKFAYGHAKSMGSYYQRGGTFRTQTGRENYIGNYFGCYYSLEGGLLHFRSTTRSAFCSDATVVVHQRGGVCFVDGCSFDSAGAGRQAYHYISGGTFALTNGEYAVVRADAEGRSSSFAQGYGALAMLTIDGTDALCDMHIIKEHLSWRTSLNLAAQHYSRGQVNLLSGGTLRSNGINKKLRAQVDTVSGAAVSEDLVGNVADIAFDGGVMEMACQMTTAAGKNIFRNFTGENDRVRVFGGGAVIDTAGKDWALGAPLEAPSGNGVEAIALPDGVANAEAWEFTASPTVEIVDPTGVGTGATAIAIFDTVNGKVTGIKITNRGNNYTSAQATISRGGHTNTWTVAATVSPNVSGGLTKKGEGTLTVDNVCTYTGTTCVAGGVLKLGVDGAINASSGIVLSGGTLDVDSKTFNVPVTVQRFDAMDNTLKRNFRIVTSEGGVGNVQISLDEELAKDGWSIVISSDGKEMFVYKPKGLKIIFR